MIFVSSQGGLGWRQQTLLSGTICMHVRTRLIIYIMPIAVCLFIDYSLSFSQVNLSKTQANSGSQTQNIL